METSHLAENNPGTASPGMKLRTRMFLLSLASFAATLIVALLCGLLINDVRINGPNYQIIRNSKDALEKIALLKSDIHQMSAEVMAFIAEHDRDNANALFEHIKDRADDIDFKYEDVQRLIESHEKRKDLAKAEGIWAEYKKTLLLEIVPAVQRGDRYHASNLLAGVQKQRFSSFSTTVAQMVDSLRRDVYHTEKQITETTRKQIAFAVFMITILTAASFLLAFYISITITKPVMQCVSFARNLAAGSLTGRLQLKADGELGELAVAMNIMAENLHGIAYRLGITTDELTKIDRSIESASQHVANATKLQEVAVSETSDTVSLLNASVLEISEGVDLLSDAATSTSSSTQQMAASIEEVAINTEKLGVSVDEVSSSMIQMAISIKGINSNISNLLAASVTTSSSVAEMDATIKQVERNAIDTATISETVKEDAANGLKSVQETIAGMQEIRRASQITAEVVENLSLHANDIGAILSVIDEVTDQTSLLALNAAIIAAQAGEQGKGFAVVADEIKELAERTSSSTREIAAVIKGVQEDTGRAVAAINQAELAVEVGEELSERSGTALEKIVDGVQRAGLQIDAIAKATVEQSKGSQSIKIAMEQVEEMVEQMANSTREHSRGSDLVTVAVERMREMTNQVRSSTREQSKTSSLIAQSTEEITVMIDRIRRACDLQREQSQTIDRTVNNIRQSSDVSSQAAKVLNSAVTNLSSQIDQLEKEMSGFKL